MNSATLLASGVPSASSIAVGLTVLLVLGGWVAISVALHASLREPASALPARDGEDSVPPDAEAAVLLNQRPHVRPAAIGTINGRSQSLVRRPCGADPHACQDRTELRTGTAAAVEDRGN